jgi:hypothetical protein
MANMSAIASMLAQSGQTIGQQIGSPVREFGTGIGGMLTARKEKQREQEAAKESQRLLQQYANNPAQLNALGQKYATEGNDALSKVFFEAAKQATATQEKRTSATIGRGKGELMALANDPKFDLNDPKMRSGYIGMADSFGVSRADAIQIALDARKERQGGDKQTFASAGRYKDKDNNIYVATEVRTKGGGVRIDYSPITPDAPENPVGKLTPIGGAYGETAPERLERGIEAASEETKAEQFSKSQQVAVDNLPKIEVAIGNAERSLELLQEIKTGGFTTAIVRSAQQFLGTEPKDQAEFNLLAGKTVLDNLSKFEGAISEGERMYLERLYQSLERSGGANQAILENLLQEAQFLLADTKVKANARNYRDYLETRPTFSSVASRDKGTKKVNFDELK